MSDTQHRQNAEILSFRAYKTENTAEKIPLHRQAIVEYSAIQNKTISDMRKIALQHDHIAVHYFNMAAFAEAAASYQASIIYTHKISETFSLEDKDYRYLCASYIDLADACTYISKLQEADEAIGNAMTAFHRIKLKNPAELAIGDPARHFQQFYEFFQKQTSHSKYMASSAFKNHEQILSRHQEDHSMADMFASCALSDQDPKELSQLHAMMEGLHTTNAAAAVFSPINLDNPVNDKDYRAIAIEYLRSNQQHIKEGNIPHAISTYHQASKALNSIKFKNSTDIAIMTTIGEKNSFLEQHLGDGTADAALLSQDDSISRTLIASMSLFHYRAPTDTDNTWGKTFDPSTRV